MKNYIYLFVIAVIALTACEPKVPTEKRFPGAQIKFDYREIEPFKLEFRNTSTPNELEAYIWRFGDDLAPATSNENPFHYFHHEIKVYDVILTCADQYRLKFLSDSQYYDSIYYNNVFLYNGSAKIVVSGIPTEEWTNGGQVPLHLLDSIAKWIP